ncbi:FecR family protein [Sphingopyxis yananensis]|uniref:FecR family protein n=1 Tax=Sphingopyxis yananensis TaxID=2886687 RepID=UPI001D0FE1DC|nr:FecR domain-containing protein [Sphingopyxis yananensis]MCC2601257.1 FecR domain-containing protein [Sphingopyxis yananensis]
MTRNASPPSSDLLSEAAFWYNEHLAGDMSDSDAKQFSSWLARSPAHRNAYGMVDRGWMIAERMQADLEQTPYVKPSRSPSNWRRHAAMAAMLFIALFISVATLPSFIKSGNDVTVQNFQTITGQRSIITLPDGTRVTMDSETELKFSDLADERRVEMLQGRAFFNVAKNAERPFIVHVDGKTVKALGTAFEVRLDGDQIAVVLAEGKVKVEDSNVRGSTEMTPGRQLVMQSDRRWTLSNVDVKKETSWTDGRLVFMNDPLSQAVTDVNRYAKRKLVFVDNQIPTTDIVGVFSSGDIDGFVKALELNGIAKQISSNDKEILLVSQRGD